MTTAITVGHQMHQLRRQLHEGVVELRFDGGFRIVARAPLLEVADHPHDFRLVVELSEMDVLTNRVLTGEVRSREDVVDNDNRRRVLVVVVGDPAAADQRHAHRPLEAGFDQIEQRLAHVVIVGGLRLAFNPEGQ